MTRTQLHFQWREPKAPGQFRTAVSLHSHTMHSRENLDFIPRLARTIPGVREALAAEERAYARRNGRLLNYAGACWTPPHPEREALRLEQRQIEERLGLAALISLTDHDNIEASSHLHLFEEYASTPVSVEWTVPFGRSFFHLGVHNLPRDEARQWMSRMAAYTAAPAACDLRALLAGLSERPEILVVFNHPLWDEMVIGQAAHREMVAGFLGRFGGWLHALELNGMRTWPENQAVLAIAAASGHPVVAGGDRHGSEPNAVLNLTNARDFAAFSDEVRRGGVSEVLVLPQYREPQRLRYAETVWDVVREYPEYTGRVRWTDRCFYRNREGVEAPLSAAWNGDGPGVVSAFFFLARLVFSRQVRPTLRLAMRARGEVLP